MSFIAYCKRKQHRISVQATRSTIKDGAWSRVYFNLSPSIPILHKSHSRFKGCFCNKQQFHLLFSPSTFGSWSFIAENFSICCLHYNILFAISQSLSVWLQSATTRSRKEKTDTITSVCRMEGTSHTFMGKRSQKFRRCWIVGKQSRSSLSESSRSQIGHICV